MRVNDNDFPIDLQRLKNGAVYVNASQSKEIAEHITHVIGEMRKAIDECAFLTQRIACAEVIAKLAISLKTTNTLFWNDGGGVSDG